MASCVFFGSRDFTGNIKALLKDVTEDLISRHGVNTFYVGHHGHFDQSAILFLKELKRTHPQIQYFVMLSRLPCPTWLADEPTILPDGIENVLPKYAILYRNDLMLDKSDYVVLYKQQSRGGTARMEARAKAKGKTIINLTDPLTLMDYDELLKGFASYNTRKAP